MRELDLDKGLSTKHGLKKVNVVVVHSTQRTPVCVFDVVG